MKVPTHSHSPVHSKCPLPWAGQMFHWENELQVGKWDPSLAPAPPWWKERATCWKLSLTSTHTSRPMHRFVFACLFVLLFLKLSLLSSVPNATARRLLPCHYPPEDCVGAPYALCKGQAMSVCSPHPPHPFPLTKAPSLSFFIVLKDPSSGGRGPRNPLFWGRSSTESLRDSHWASGLRRGL